MHAERSPRHPIEIESHAEARERTKLLGRSPTNPGLLLLAIALCWVCWPAPAHAQPSCSHDICDVGPSLNSNCDPCVTDICQVDSYCCNTEWDQTCVDQVLTICGDPRCAEICSHSPCDTGDALDSTCNSCTALVCFLDPSCCDAAAGSWNSACVNMVQTQCGVTCDPGADTCSNAPPVSTGKIYGTLEGASNDGCASAPGQPGGVSCQSPDVWYEYTHVIDQDLIISTCTTQRSFGIDSVVSVHEGATVQQRCPGRQNNEIIANDDWGIGQALTACITDPDPNNLDAAVPISGVYAIPLGETVVIRVSHHNDSAANPFELRILPEPSGWLALLAGAGALGALSRRRARG